MIKRGIGLAAALAALLAAGPAPQSMEAGVAWAKSWDEAKREAMERNVPIFFTVQQDENAGCKQMEGAFRDGSFISQSRRVVCVVANPDVKHGIREVMVNKQKVAYCRAYDGMVCASHVTCQNALENFFKMGGDFDIPCQVWCKPDGTEIFKMTRFQGYPQSASEIIKDMERALDRVSGPKLNRNEWVELKNLLRQGEEATDKQEYKAALGFFKKVSECKNEKFAKIGKDRHDGLIEQCVSLVARAIRQYEKAAEGSKQRKEVPPLLKKIAKEMKGNAAGDAAEKALKDLNIK